MDKTFGAFLAQKRKEKNLTQKELADIMCVSESAISKWEINKAFPDITRIEKLCSLFNLSEHELLTASIDYEARQNCKKIEKYNKIEKTLFWFFVASYSVALIICLIVDICKGRLLSFVTVLLSLSLAASFTTFPKLFSKYKLFHISFSEMTCLFALLGFLAFKNKENWFLTATIPVFTAYLYVFLPLFIKYYKFPVWIKNNSLVFCTLVDYFATLIMLAYLCGPYFAPLALPITSYGLLFPLVFVCLNKTSLNRKVKAGVIVIIYDVLLSLSGYVVYFFMKPIFPEEHYSLPFDKINLLLWTSDSIGSNIMIILFLMSFFIGLVLIIEGKKE